MTRVTTLSLCLAVLLLTSCSKSKPTTPSTPSPAVTADASTTTTTTTTSDPGAPTATATLPAAITYTVQRTTIEDLFTFNAKFAPSEYPLSFSQDGTIKTIAVKPGQMVQEGDLIAQLDLSDLETQLSEAQLNVEQAQRAITQASQTSKLEVEQSQLSLEAARQDLEKAKAPPATVVVAQAQANVRAAQSNLATVKNNTSQAKNQAKAAMEKAATDLQTIQNQYSDAINKRKKATGQKAKDLDDEIKKLEDQMHAGENALATAIINYDTARNNEAAAVSDAEAKLDLAQAQLDDLFKGPDKFIIAEKERAVRAAEIAVAQANQRSTTDPTLIKAVDSSKFQVKQIEAQIAARQLHAPISGEVASVNAPPGTPILIGNPVVTLINRSNMKLEASEADMLANGRTSLPKLAINQVVEITFSRYKDKTLSGTISKVPVVPTDGTPATDTSYNFDFNTQGLSFDPGDVAEIKIILGRKTNALYLPPDAIRTVRDRSSVTQRTGDQDKRVDVVIGIVTSDKVEIISGLKEGDIVLAAE